MIRSLKSKAGEVLLVGADVLGMLLSASGAAVVAFLGKLMLAVVLAALALGFFLRFKDRKGLKATPPQRPPWWHHAASFTLAAIEAAMLVEATHLPVRFDQPGFAAWHWVLVLAAVAVAYSLHMRLFKALLRRRDAVSVR
jgi:hypothetical protein